MNKSQLVTILSRGCTNPHGILHRNVTQARGKPRRAPLQSHWLKNLTPWKTTEEVAKVLQENVLYNSGNETFC